jgi:bifunctional non-homologous end joining protein LigD
MSKPESIALYFREGGSDKVYQAQLALENGGFVVHFQYGRRGSALATGKKTALPLAYDAAKKVYDALVKSKTSKGYTPSEEGTPYQDTPDEARSTGLVVQVLTPIREEEVERYIKDDAHIAQEKYDGERRPVAVHSGGAIGSNKRGLEVALPKALAKSVAMFDLCTELDCEQVGDTLFVFDILSDGVTDVRGLSCGQRLARLLQAFARAGTPGNIQLVATAIGTAEKRALFNRLKAEGREGIVFKRESARYTPGKLPNLDQIKFKFVESATVEVASVHPSKRSVGVQVYTTLLGAAMPLGSVTIPANHQIPAVGDIVEVKYLYCMGSLIQPVYIGRRGDQIQADCTVEQLKMKSVEAK